MLMKQLLPMLVGVFARQVNSIVDQFFASFLALGSITALENASRIYLLPVGVFGVTISNVVFPNLSKSASEGNKSEISKSITHSFNLLSFLTIPSLFVLIFYAKDIIKLIFSYGKFNENAVNVTSEALIYYSLGLIFYVGVQLISKAYYAMGDSKRPAKYSIIAIILNIVLNVLLIKYMKHKGLALATAVSAALNFFLLLIFFIKYYVKLDLENITFMILKILVKTIIAIYISSFFKNIFISLFVFSVIYLLLWSYSIYKYRQEMFYKND